MIFWPCSQTFLALLVFFLMILTQVLELEQIGISAQSADPAHPDTATVTLMASVSKTTFVEKITATSFGVLQVQVLTAAFLVTLSLGYLALPKIFHSVDLDFKLQK